MVFCWLDIASMHNNCHRGWGLCLHLGKRVTCRGLLLNGNASQLHFAFSHLVCHPQETTNQKKKKVGKATMGLKASAKQKTKVHWKRCLSERGTEDLLGLFQGDAASKVSNFLKKAEAGLVLARPRSCSAGDSSFRVWQNCKEGLSWWNEMRRAHETTAKRSCYPVMCRAWLHQWSSIALQGVHSTEVSVHCSGTAALPCMGFFFPMILLQLPNLWHISVKTLIVLLGLRIGVKCKVHCNLWMQN